MKRRRFWFPGSPAAPRDDTGGTHDQRMYGFEMRSLTQVRSPGGIRTDSDGKRSGLVGVAVGRFCELALRPSRPIREAAVPGGLAAFAKTSDLDRREKRSARLFACSGKTCGLAECGVEPILPSRPIRLKMFEHIAINPQRDLLTRIWDGGRFFCWNGFLDGLGRRFPEGRFRRVPGTHRRSGHGSIFLPILPFTYSCFDDTLPSPAFVRLKPASPEGSNG